MSTMEAGLRRSRRLNDYHTELVDQVLAEPDLDAVVKRMAYKIHGDVLVYAPDGAVLSASGERPAEQKTAMASAALAAHTAGKPVRLADAQLAIPIIAGDEGVATMLARPGDGEEIDHEHLRMFAQAAAVAFLVQRGITDATTGKDRDPLEDVLARRPASAAELARRARRAGMNLCEPYVVVVARPAEKSQGRLQIWASSFTLRSGGLKSIQAGAAVLVVPGTDASATAQLVRNELASFLGTEATVGAAGPVSGPGALLPGYQRASRCLDAILALGDMGKAASFDELGFLGLLLSDPPDIENFVENTIGPVLRYDGERNAHLKETLAAYFEADRSPTRAADRLYVHPNTVGRRLERVTDLLGTGWQKPEQMVDVQLALRILRIRALMKQATRRPADYNE
ncbi:hypothetical protein BKN51_20680 [Amycolatopsis sp. BJA-103]|nr:hypothetical protein BKN51_20680 [Amycolatopsis sp. BJA-103]